MKKTNLPALMLHSFVACLFGFIVPFIIAGFEMPLAYTMPEQAFVDWGDTAARTLTGLGLIAVLVKAGWVHLAGLNLKINWRGTPLGWLCLLATASPAIGIVETGFQANPDGWILAADTLAVGFVEEVVFRGFVFAWLLTVWRGHRYDLIAPCLLSGLSFGLAHYDPVFLLAGPMFGLIFCRLLIAFKTITIPVIGHFLFNFTSGYPVDATGIEIDHIGTVLPLPLLLICVVWTILDFTRSRVVWPPDDGVSLDISKPDEPEEATPAP